MNIKSKRLLVLSPHPDDAEVGAGGLINHLAGQVDYKYWIAFSKCQESLPFDADKGTLCKEMKRAVHHLGFRNDFFVYGYPVRNFHFHRQSLLEALVFINKTMNPDLVLLPSRFDIHQDHQIIRQEGERAFKTSTILGYEISRNCKGFFPDLYFPLTEEQVDLKTKAFLCYESQAHRPYGNGAFIKNTAAFRGQQIDEQYAEAYEVIRMLWRS